MTVEIPQERIIEERKNKLDLTISPDRELQDGKYYWFKFNKGKLGLTHLGLKDEETGIIISASFVDPTDRVAARKAWAGARQSRSPKYPWEILAEINENTGETPDQKIDNTVNSFGHASVADMARMHLSFSDCPIHLPLNLFNLGSINSGQEKSTRYQKQFGIAPLHSIRNYFEKGELSELNLSGLEQHYQALGQISQNIVALNRERISSAFKKYFQPVNEGEEKSLASRVMDCTRYSILMGQFCGFDYETSARDWSRIIGELRSSNNPLYKKVSDQLQHFLVMENESENFLGIKSEAPGLIRHTEKGIVNEKISQLKKYLEEETNLSKVVKRNYLLGDFKPQDLTYIKSFKDVNDVQKAVMQYIKIIWPSMDEFQIIDWIDSQSIETKKELSKIIFSGHNHHQVLPTLAQITNHTFDMDIGLGETRDLNRHRTAGRFVNLPMVYGLKIDFSTAKEILSFGFTLPLYLTEVPEFKQIGEQFKNDLRAYYNHLNKFVRKNHDTFLGNNADYSFILNLLPLAHRVNFFMHFNLKDSFYTSVLRERPGGHINYRDIAWQMNEAQMNNNPLLEGLKLSSKRPDPANRDQFFNRS